MRRLALLAWILVLGSAVLARPHGGTFPPPPPAGGGGNGGPGGPGDTSPPSGGPSAPAPSGPSTGAPAPTGPSTGRPAPASAPTGGTTGSVPTGARPSAVPIATTSYGLDPTSWELWWRYNRSEILDLKARVESRSPATLGATGALDERYARGLAAASAALERETQRDLVSSLIVALAHAGDDSGAPTARECATRIAPFVANADQEIGETAAAALGILRQPAALLDLAGLLHDDERGQKLAKGPVSTRTRAFAAYGLGLAAARTGRADLSTFAAHHLSRCLAASRYAANAELQAACVIALGIVPGAPDEGGELVTLQRRSKRDEPHEPRTRAAHAALLLDVLGDEARPASVRAHVPDALARLAVDATGDLRAAIARELALLAAREEREDPAIQRGAVLALGRLGDCDDDAADVRIRAALARALAADDALARLFALVSLAQVAGRPGQSDDPTAVQNDARDVLLDRLVRGKNRERSWAALALGLLERARLAQGRDPSAAVRSSLRRALADAGAVDQIGAFAIGIGLAQDRGATKDLLKRFADVQEPVARGHLATALGLLGAPEAAAPLRALLPKSRYQPELLREVAIALALLGDPGVENALLLELGNARSLSAQAGLARAIGFAGSLDTVAPLVRLLEDAAETSGARAFSAVALGMVLDRERLPWNAVLASGVNYPSAPASLSDGRAGILDIL